MTQWYKVKYPVGSVPFALREYVVHRQASSIDEVKAMFHPENVPHLIITEAPEYQAKIDEWNYWRSLWVAALNNMPYISVSKQHGYPMAGRSMALAMCLGYKFRGRNGRSNAGTRIYDCMRNSVKPSTAWRRQALKKLAGPNGTMFARVHLMKLGEDKRFKYWPK